MQNLVTIDGKEPIRITLSEFNGKKHLDLRRYYYKDNDLLPTKKGITINNNDDFLIMLKTLSENKKEIELWLKQ